MFFFVILSGSLKSEPGQLIDYTHQSTMTQDEIIFILWFAGFDPVADFGISVYDIKYETEGEGGYIDTLSGLVAFPHSPIEAFPILSYQHGTAVNDASAPSLAGLTMDNPEVLIISLVTAPSGFITLFPDYEGLGDPNKFHPFIIAESYTHSVVNMVRAVKQLSAELEGDDQFQFNDQLFLIGYSEGGYATMAVQRGIELNFSDEFTITTSCPMAGPYDLAGTMVDYFLSIPSYPKPFYVPFVLTSHLWYYQGEDVDFGDYFEPFWADTLPSLFDGTHFGDEIDALMPENPLDIILPDVLEEFTNNEDHFFRQTLQQNTLLDWIPMSPTYLYHGIGDDIVPFQNAQVAYDTFVSNGADSVTLTLYPEEMGGHGEVATTCLFAGFDVISDRQAISPKGDLNSDSYIMVQDVDLILDSIVHETDLTDFQWWAGDCDYDDQHSVIDLLMVADLID
jgi:predicted esterase